MPHLAKVSGQWSAVKAYAKVGGAWRLVPQLYTRVAGVWKPLWSYSWDAGAWGDCSVTCGGGTQTRPVTCKRQDGLAMDDGVCARFAGAKPDTSQACNTQSCYQCLYSDSYYWIAGGESIGDYHYAALMVVWNGVTCFSSSPVSADAAIKVTSVTGCGRTFNRGSRVSGVGTGSSINYYYVCS